MPQAIRTPTRIKPRKPHRDYPLFAHQNGQWAKKIRGKVHYFGTWGDPEAALDRYLDDKDDLLAGRIPRRTTDGLTIRDLTNQFLTTKRQRADIGEIKSKTFADYHRSCKAVVKAFGLNRLAMDLGPVDFEQLRQQLAKSRGPVGLANEIQRIRVLFKYAFDQGLIDRPAQYGQSFKKPSGRILRQARIAAGPRMFEAKQIRMILEAASYAVRAMVLLGINAGLGNTDVASLPRTALDLNAGWIDFPRPKTAVHRRISLWPETINALETALNDRPIPKSDDANALVFITKYGQPWVRFRRIDADPEKGLEARESWSDAIGLEFRKLLEGLGLKRPGLSFYALRHTFETIGGESLDQVAVDHIMGHVPHGNDMGAVYRERISDERLKRVTDHVHGWLFPPKEAKSTARAQKPGKAGKRAKPKPK